MEELVHSAAEQDQKEFRIFGPPGTGKTTYMARQLEVAASRYGPREIMVASFTRTAATEIAGRKTDVPKDRINTLHGHCYRAIGGKEREIAEERIADWNKFAPQYAMSETEKVDVEDQATEGNFATQGDEYMSMLSVLRAKMIDYRMYPQSIRLFAEKWKSFKDEHNLIDFTDMIEWSYHFIDEAPESPRIGFFDETQDFTPLELALIRKWAQRMDRVVLAGDDDQCIYDFKGATPEAFLHPDIPETHKRILKQSYRVPRKVQAYANKLIHQVKHREPKEYLPRDEEGELRRCSGSFRNIEPLLYDAEQYLSAGKSVMFLAACGYMLDPLKAALRGAGLPFHNPYRRKRFDWNPLQVNGTSAAARLLAFLRLDREVHGDKASFWTHDDMALWTEHLKAKGYLLRGAKTAFSQFEGEAEVEIDRLLGLFETEPLIHLLGLNTTAERIEWLEKALLETKLKPYQYPIQILQKRGAEGLYEEPKIVIGSIHSVKGGQADVVYLFPDLSLAGMKQYQKAQSRDGIIRQFYVGMTRARESLILAQNATAYRIPL